MSQPGDMISSRCRTASRSRRLVRFRRTALPIFFPATNPKRLDVLSFADARSTISGCDHDLPLSQTRWKSSRQRLNARFICHPERSEGSRGLSSEILRRCAAQNDLWSFLFQIRARGGNGEALAPAQAARGEHFASPLGLHSFSKTVRAFPFQALGLIYSLQRNSSFIQDGGGYYTLKLGK